MWQVTEGAALELEGRAVLIIGCGAVGSAFGRAFQELGAELWLWSRHAERADELAKTLGAESTHDLQAGLQRAELVGLALADDALEGFVQGLAPGAGSSGFCFHTNGSAGLELLEPMRSLGWNTGKLHPLRAFPQAGGAAAAALRDTWFATLADRDAGPFCTGLVRALGGHELRLGPEPGASLGLHAAASLLSGGLVALFDQALSVANAAVEEPQAARAALEALLSSTVDNLARSEPAEALSGPIARGAEGLVARQLEALSGADQALYRQLGRRMLELSHARSPMSPEKLKRLRELLS